jgi:hypothetical protein
MVRKYGYATPCVIERLQSDSIELRQAAQGFLRSVSGRDFGSDIRRWQNWWRDPPHEIGGVDMIGHHTGQFLIPITGCLTGFVVMIAGRRFRRNLPEVLGATLLIVGWFQLIGAAGLRYVGSFDHCRFGGTEIVYHADHGVVTGLQDAYPGGAGLWLLLCVTFVAVPFLVTLIAALLTKSPKALQKIH